MKNATKHASTLRSLHRKLTRQHRAPERPQLDPVRALVMGVLCEECDDARALRAMEVFDGEFVDLNELRVATELELAAMIGHRYPAAGERAVRLRELLMSLFDGEGRLCAARITAMNKKDQRAALRSLPLITPFVEGYVSLTGFGQAAVPMDDSMLQLLYLHDALEPQATLEEAQRFVEAHLKADECWPFFWACRIAAFKAKGRPKARTRAPRSAARAKGKTLPRRKLASSK